jgi:dihydroflavonol-4-reductase
METNDFVAVSGATGFIGSAIVRKLIERGRSVRALIEPGANLANLEDLPEGRVERVIVDVCDYVAMARALDGVIAYYHLAAIYKVWTPDPSAIYRVNVEGTTTAMLAARAAKVPRVVYTSSIAAVGLRPGDEPANETVEFNSYDIANEYILTKYLSERIALRFAEAGSPIVVVNPAFPFGRGDNAPTPTGKLILSLLRDELPALSDGGFCAIDVDDVAEAHLAAETRGRVGERYILGNHNVTFRHFADEVCAVAGIAPPKVTLPSFVGRGLAKGMELWSSHVSHEEPRVTEKSLQFLQRKAYYDNTKATEELGLAKTPLRTSIERAVQYFRARRMAPSGAAQ